MKQLAKYKINFDSKWILFSVALMGIACFFHAMHFFVLTKPQDATGLQLALYLIVPMVLELTWIVLLHSFRHNAPGLYAILGALMCILLLVQCCLGGGTVRIIFAVLGYLIGGGTMIMILGGFFPYKYIGLLYFAVIFVLRFFLDEIPGLIRLGKMAELAQVLPGLCMVGSVALFFGGIIGVRNKK